MPQSLRCFIVAAEFRPPARAAAGARCGRAGHGLAGGAAVECRLDLDLIVISMRVGGKLGRGQAPAMRLCATDAGDDHGAVGADQPPTAFTRWICGCALGAVQGPVATSVQSRDHQLTEAWDMGASCPDPGSRPAGHGAERSRRAPRSRRCASRFWNVRQCRAGPFPIWPRCAPASLPPRPRMAHGRPRLAGVVCRISSFWPVIAPRVPPHARHRRSFHRRTVPAPG